MELPERKRNRLKYCDYSKPGAYFITICTKDRREILAQPITVNDVGAGIARPKTEMMLLPYGKIVNDAIIGISEHYDNALVDSYVIMPNHVHLILLLYPSQGGRAMPAPTISRIVQHMKGYATKHIGQMIWQKLFHDHVIRDRESLAKIREYIQTNPQTWENDCFYTTEI